MNDRPLGDRPGSPFSLWSFKDHRIWETTTFTPPGSPLPARRAGVSDIWGGDAQVWAVVLLLWTGDVLGVGDHKGSCMGN